MRKTYLSESHINGLVRGLISLVIIAILALCLTIESSLGQSDQGDKDDWTKTLPVQPGDSLKNKSVPDKEKQVITIFKLSDMRNVDGSVFISGTGYAEINGGEKFFCGPNRGLDPYLEVTITSPNSRAFQRCKKILNQKKLVHNAIAIKGEGYFTSRPGIGDRKLGVFQLDTVSGCKLVQRQ